MTAQDRKIVILSSCTASKYHEGPGIPLATAAELDDRDMRASLYVDRADWILQVFKAYTGRQLTEAWAAHCRLKELSGVTSEFFVFSAGWGIVHSDDWIFPYNVTFRDAGALAQRERGRVLGMPKAYLHILKGADIVLHLLGADYLIPLNLGGVDLPPDPLLIFFGGAAMVRIVPRFANVRLVQLVRADTVKYKAAMTDLKGYVLRALVNHFISHPGAIESLLEDPDRIREMMQPQDCLRQSAPPIQARLLGDVM